MARRPGGSEEQCQEAGWLEGQDRLSWTRETVLLGAVTHTLAENVDLSLASDEILGRERRRYEWTTLPDTMLAVAARCLDCRLIPGL